MTLSWYRPYTVSLKLHENIQKVEQKLSKYKIFDRRYIFYNVIKTLTRHIFLLIGYIN